MLTYLPVNMLDAHSPPFGGVPKAGWFLLKMEHGLRGCFAPQINLIRLNPRLKIRGISVPFFLCGDAMSYFTFADRLSTFLGIYYPVEGVYMILEGCYFIIAGAHTTISLGHYPSLRCSAALYL